MYIPVSYTHLDVYKRQVQTNSATSEECAAASHEMSNEAENLREMIRKFKVAKFEKTEK